LSRVIFVREKKKQIGSGRKKGLLAELSQTVARSHRKLTCIANPL